jgi:hypothetical protein
MGRISTSHEINRRTESVQSIIYLSRIRSSSRLRPPRLLVSRDTLSDSPVAGLEKYEDRKDAENHTCRMLVNLSAALVSLALILIGDWIVVTLVHTGQASRTTVQTAQDTRTPALVWMMRP